MEIALILTIIFSLAATQCSNDSGQWGQCVSTSECAAAGGRSEPGHCAGPVDIQCCTYNCYARGQVGECILANACAAAGGISEAGHCPGPTNVQCCTYGTCQEDTGRCQPVDTCVGTSTPHLCPGSASIQCCTIDPCDADGTGGQCLSGDVCIGFSTPGICSDSEASIQQSNAQCCTPTNPKGSKPCTPPDVNSATITLLKNSEVFVPSPSPDPVGYPTVGYGHKCQKPNCAEVPYTFPMTEAQATELLKRDLRTFQRVISDTVADTVVLNENQYGALCSWAFNEGPVNAKSSTLVKRLNAGEDPNTVAAEELPRWNKCGRPLKVCDGLVLRRNREITLFQMPSGIVAHPPCTANPPSPGQAVLEGAKDL